MGVYIIILNGCSQHNGSQNDTKFVPVVDIFVENDKEEIDLDTTSFENAKTKLIGFKDNHNRVIIPAQYTRNHPNGFSKYGIATVQLPSDNKNWYKINKAGHIIVQSFFFDNGPDYYMAGLSRFTTGNKIGFINQKAEIVISAQFDWASTFSYSAPIAIVSVGCHLEERKPNEACDCGRNLIGGKWGIIDMDGKIIVPLDYDNYESYSNQCVSAVVLTKNNQKYRLLHNDIGMYKLEKL